LQATWQQDADATAATGFFLGAIWSACYKLTF